MNVFRQEHSLKHAQLEQIIPNTLRYNKLEEQLSTAQYRNNINVQNQQNLGVFQSNKNKYNVFEYQQGHPTHDRKSSEIHPLTSRPCTEKMNEIYSRNDIVQRTLDKMVNVSGTMIKNSDLPIQAGRKSA